MTNEDPAVYICHPGQCCDGWCVEVASVEVHALSDKSQAEDVADALKLAGATAADLATAIVTRGEVIYARDVFIPPTPEQFAEVNALLKRERGHQLDGIAAECYRRAHASIAADVREGRIWSYVPGKDGA